MTETIVGLALSTLVGVVVGWRIGGLRLTRRERRLAVEVFTAGSTSTAIPTSLTAVAPDWVARE